MKLIEVYNAHINYLEEKINSKTNQEINLLLQTVFNFYLNFDSFEKTIQKHIFKDFNQTNFIKDIQNSCLEIYRKADEHSTRNTDEYANDYEEIEELELWLLSGFSNFITENKKSGLLYLFDGILNLLDYYEHFSYRPQFWNNLIEKELNNQRLILNSNEIDSSFYLKKYKNIQFEAL